MGLLLLALLCGCGGKQRTGRGGGDDETPFQCNDRRAAYNVTGTVMGAAYGVRLYCDGDMPMVEEVRTNDKGVETQRGARIDTDAWEEVWSDLEHTGWRNVGDCKDDEDADEKTPFWVVEVGDGDNAISVTCKAKQLPFPFDTMVMALDKGRGELPLTGGDD
jgi:hypothetical protein